MQYKCACVCVHVRVHMYICTHVNAQTTHGKSEKIRRAKQSSRRNLCVCVLQVLCIHTHVDVLCICLHIYIYQTTTKHACYKNVSKKIHTKNGRICSCATGKHTNSHTNVCMLYTYICRYVHDT